MAGGKAGKKKKEKKKKKGKGGDGSAIAAAIMPTATIAAVPRSPPPMAMSPGEVPLPTTTGSQVLSSSILGRMFTTPEPGEVQPSDTDTSLYDYENTRDTPYASLDMNGEGPSQAGKRISYSQRARVPTPPLEYRDDYSDMGEADRDLPNSGVVGPHYDELEDEGDLSPEPLYSQPRKMGPKKSKKRSQERQSPIERPASPLPGSSMARFSDDDARATGSLRNSRTLTSRSVSPRSSPEPIMVERQILTGSQGRPSLPAGDLPIREVVDVGVYTTPQASPRLRLTRLQQQNEELLVQQRVLQDQLQMQQQQQQHIMTRLQEQGMLASMKPDQANAEEMGTLLQETQSVTETTLNRQEMMIKSLQDRSAILEQEHQQLKELNEQLEAENNSLKKLASIKESDENAGTQTLMMKKHIQDYKEENDTLKNTVHRLNVELSRYQAKYRPLDPGETAEIVGLPIKGPTPSWLINTKYLAPLFAAYDDRLQEKEELILKYEDEMDTFKNRIEDIVRENQRLHLRVEQSDISGPISMTEWKQLQEQAKLVLEENQLLMEQLDVQQNKAKDMHRAHVQEVSRLSKQVMLLESEKNQLESEMTEVRNKFTEMRQKHDTVLIETKTKLSMEDHIHTVTDIRKTLEEEKLKYSNDLQNVNAKLYSTQADKKGLELQVADMSSEKKRLESELKSLQKTNRKLQQKASQMEKTLEGFEKKEHLATHYLSSVLKMAEKTAMERDTFAQVAQTHEKQKQKAITRVMEGNVQVGKMEEKMKLYKLKLVDKLNSAVGKIKEKDSEFEKERFEYEREIKHLRMLLQERDDMLNNAVGEKHRIEDDLEMMWQAAARENQRMQDTLRQSIRKLREHEHLEKAIKEEEKRDEEILHVSEDETK